MSTPSGSMTNIELLTALGRIYGFEVQKREQEEQTMPNMCKKNCGRYAQSGNDGMCKRCYKEEKGMPVRPHRDRKPSGEQAKGRAEKEHAGALAAAFNGFNVTVVIPARDLEEFEKIVKAINFLRTP